VQNQTCLSYAKAQPLLQAQPEITRKPKIKITTNLFNEFLAMQEDECRFILLFFCMKNSL